MTSAPDPKAAAAICFETIELEEDKYRLGHTKLFFRTGVVAHLEELREEKIQQMMRCIQVRFSHKKWQVMGFLFRIKIKPSNIDVIF